MTMKKADVQIGATYLVKVAGNLVPVKIDAEHDNGGWVGTSQKTGKSIRIKSPQRLRKRLGDVPVARKRIVTKAEYEAEARAEAADTPRANPSTPVGSDEASTGERDATCGEREAIATKPMSLLNAAAEVLAIGDAMRCRDIVNVAIAKGLWQPGKGKTPANTLSAAIRREIKTKGDASRFSLSERGKFELNR
jgi:hypothetical protein